LSSFFISRELMGGILFKRAPIYMHTVERRFFKTRANDEVESIKYPLITTHFTFLS